MVVGAPSRCTRYTHASDGSGWSSGDVGSSLKPDLANPDEARTVNSNNSERLLRGIARFIRLSGKLATMATHSGLRRSLVFLKISLCCECSH